MATASARGEAQQRLAGALSRFWRSRGHIVEGARRLEAAVAADPRPTEARANTLLGAAATIVVARADYETAKQWAAEALELCRALGFQWGIAYAHFLFGFAAVEAGDFASAPAPLEESVRLFRELGDERFLGIAIFNLAWALEETGDRDRARALDLENLERARAMGDARLEAFALDALETRARGEGRYREALELQAETMRIVRTQENPLHVADTLSRFAAALAPLGETKRAAELLSRSLAAYEELGVSVPRYNRERNEGTLEHLRARLDEATLADAFAQGRRLTLDEAVAVALAELA